MRSKWKQEISNRPNNSLCGVSHSVRVALEAIVGGDARWRFDNHNKSHHQSQEISACTAHKIEMST